jgi:hypothetical protein
MAGGAVEFELPGGRCVIFKTGVTTIRGIQFKS